MSLIAGTSCIFSVPGGLFFDAFTRCRNISASCFNAPMLFVLFDYIGSSCELFLITFMRCFSVIIISFCILFCCISDLCGNNLTLAVVRSDLVLGIYTLWQQ